MPRITRSALSIGDADLTEVLRALAPAATGTNDDGSKFSYAPADDTATGSIAAVSGAVTLALSEGMSSASFSLTGTFVATAQFEVSVDGGTAYTSLASTRADGTLVPAISTNVVGLWEAAIPAGATHLRLRASAWTSGSITARVNASYSAYETAVAVTSLPALPAGAAAIGTVGVTGRANGGLSPYKNLSVGAGAVVKATAGNLYSLHVTNTAATPRYVKVYNKATAPTVGTDTPVLVFAVPAGQQFRFDAANIGISFAAGIGIAATTGVLDTDTTLASANEVVATGVYV